MILDCIVLIVLECYLRELKDWNFLVKKIKICMICILKCGCYGDVK